MVSGFVALAFQGKEITGKIVVAKVRMITFFITAESVRRNHPVGNYSNSGNC